MTYIFIVLMAMGAWAQPDACSTVELDRDTEGLASIPKWSQGNTNLCYAYTAANLIDAYRFRHGDKDVNHITSPLLLAAQTIESHRDVGSSLKNGRVEHAFATARSHGTCSAKMISDHLGPYNTEAIIASLTAHHKAARESSDAKIVNAERTRQFLQLSGLKGEDIPSAQELEKNIGLALEEFVGRTLSFYCRDQKKLDYLPIQKTLFQPRRTPVEISEKLNTLLSSRIPVGINFCSTVVTEPHHKGYFEENRWRCGGNLNHSALVAGRKVINGRCHYLVRDTACSSYKKGGTSYCEDGQYWLDGEQLTANLEGIYWLE